MLTRLITHFLLSVCAWLIINLFIVEISFLQYLFVEITIVILQKISIFISSQITNNDNRPT